MKTRPNQDNNDGKSSPRNVTSQDKQDGDDTEEEDEDEDHDEPVRISTTVAESCSASHEFEWLNPNVQTMSYTSSDKQGDRIAFAEESSADVQQASTIEEQGSASCQVSPARSQYHYYRSSGPFWPRRPPDQMDQMRMSPSPCHELYACHRHQSPMRSSWCCPSPPPHAVCLHHHGGSIISGLELVPMSRDCYSSDPSCWSYQGCSCLPPTGLPQSTRHHEPHNWCQNTSPHHEILRREASSPCASHRHCQNSGGSRKSRSSSSRKRDYSPSALSPRYSPVSHEQINRSSGHEKWQSSMQSDETNLQKIQQLETDKKNLILQASVLADQVEAQSDKITELERILEQKKDELSHLEQSLHQEMLTRATIEKSKLEIMTELSSLKLRLTAAEKDRKDSDERCRRLENELVLLHARLTEKDAEQMLLRNKIIRNGTVVSTNEKNTEIEKLKLALDTIMISNEDKDRKIEDLRNSLSKYKKLQEFVLSNHARKASDASAKDAPLGEGDVLSLNSITVETPQDLHHINAKKPPHIPSSHTASTSNTPDPEVALLNWKNISSHSNCSSNFIATSSSLQDVPAFHKSNSVDNMCPTTSNMSSTKTQFGTIPRQTGPQVLQHLQDQLQKHETIEKASTSGSISTIDGLPCHPVSNESQPSGSGEDVPRYRNKSSGVSFGKGFFKLRSGKRSSSAPELAPDESISTIPREDNSSSTLPSSLYPYGHKMDKDKNKGLMKIFSKWKRTGSQNIEKFESEFKRGGIRSTAGPRLGWSRDVRTDPDIPFTNWNTDLIVDWLHRLGLSMYISECKRWMCNGEKLLKSTSQELEKELNIKNPMHKKKLILAIKSTNTAEFNLPLAINTLDYQWVVRWLDDVGLPQYKDAFADARVDGRVLHFLTVDDLLYLKVTSQLHHASIRRGIQILREKKFDPHCLIRRSYPDENKVYTPEMVALWSNHRVMEWLRTVDLSEYAPNLRGSGVHGALIVHEPKFNTDLFATMLNIPPTKTLLRRHLATHFKHIVGAELMQEKREKQSEVPLSPSVKVKSTRKTQFPLKKKRSKNELEEDYVCPMENFSNIESPKHNEGEKLVVRRNSDPSPQEQRHLQDDTGIRIGSSSKELLTTLLQSGTSLEEVPTTIV